MSGKKIDVAGELWAATTEGFVADAKQVRLGVDAVVEDLGTFEENDEFLHVITDAEGRVLYGMRRDGRPLFPRNEMYEVTENPEWLKVVVDAKGHVLFGIRRDGELVEARVPLQTRAALEALRADTEKSVGALRDELRRNVLAVEMDRDTGQIVGFTGTDSRITGCVQDRVTGEIVIRQAVE